MGESQRGRGLDRRHNRRIILFQVDTNNRVGLNKAVANNEIDYLYVAGATSKTGGITSFRRPAGFTSA